jgi:putative tryptophan/tyrosine transport system permease protein
MPFLLIVCEQLFLHIPLLLGSYISFSLMKVPDLSIESAYVCGAFCGAQAAIFLSPHHVMIQAIGALVASILAGGCVGLVSSGLTRTLKISHLLSTIMTAGFFYGINQLIGGSYLSLSSARNPFLTDFISKYPELPLLLLVAFATVLFAFFLLRTELGYSFAVYGANANFFKHYGISETYIFMVGIVIANMLGGLSGYLCAQTSGFVEINMASSKSLFCLTALIFGKVLIRSSAPLVLSRPIVGGSFYFLLQQTLLRIGCNLRYFTSIQACTVLIILCITQRSAPRANNDLLGV